MGVGGVRGGGAQQRMSVIQDSVLFVEKALESHPGSTWQRASPQSDEPQSSPSRSEARSVRWSVTPKHAVL